ncbi:claspin-like [Acanthaster planci]|uniref:Claspin-like n=1 Tax=Acanthaster planci TaxID=133434 RepID=A0A8B7ZN29_ACAPL|nr:claspin-like [Acanthaster planci]
MLGVENSEVQPLQVQPLLLDSDLFDAEDSDSDADYARRSPTPPLQGVASPQSDRRTSPIHEDSPRHQDDEDRASSHSDDEENEPDIHRQKSPISKSKRAKSSIAQSRNRRVPKTDIKKIHSESQRLIRESDLSLPYHKPKPLSLNDFFSKKPSNSGMLSVKPLKGLSKCRQMASLVQKQNSAVPVVLNESTARSQVSSKTSAQSNLHGPLSQSTCTNIIIDAGNFPDGGKEISPLEKKVLSDVNTSIEELGEDCHVEEESKVHSPVKDLSDRNKKTDTVMGETMIAEIDTEVKDTLKPQDRNLSDMDAQSFTCISPKTIGPFEDEMKGDGILRQEDENKGRMQSSVNLDEEENHLHFHDATIPVATSAVQEDDANISITPSSTADREPASSQTPIFTQSHRQKLLEASLSKVKTLTPRLSGEEESVIDLDDADSDSEAGFATPCNPGLNRLMERFVRHTARSTPRPQKEVKLSVVSKETGGDGQENLKLETVAVTIEGEDHEDPSLNVPGAKLLKLKEALQEKMRARREVERQRRKEAYRLDNEDYNEEEGEMTDKSDTDDDSDGGLRDDQSDVDLRDDRSDCDLRDTRKEKKIKKSQFINHEADVDDDDEDYEPGEDGDEYDNDSDTDSSRRDSDASDAEDREMRHDDAENLRVYSAETDDEDTSDDQEEDKIKRASTSKAKKKTMILDDDDDDDGDGRDDVARMEETSSGPTLELHLDADDEEEQEEKTDQDRDDSLMQIPAKHLGLTLGSEVNSPGSSKYPNSNTTSPRVPPLTESGNSQESTTDSYDIDKLGEAIMQQAGSPRKAHLTLEEKTRDLFESTSNTEGGTTGSNETDKASESFTGRTSFSWSAIKKPQGATQEDSNRELPKQVDTSSNSLDTSFELIGSVIPAHQPGGGLRRNSRKASEEAQEAFKPFSKHRSLLQNASKSSFRLSELTLPIEDSQDLFRVDTPSLTVAMETQPGAETQSFRFSYEEDETQTQFLDENGFLKLRSASKPKPSTKRLFEVENGSQEDLDELLGLCSGKFTGAPESSSKIRKGLFSQLSSQRVEATQGNMDELLGLCSGTFASQRDTQAKTTQPIQNGADTHSESSFHIVSDNEGNHGNQDSQPALSDGEDSRPKKRKRIRVMEDEDSGEDDDGGDDAEETAEDEDGDEVFDSEDELSFLLQQEGRQEKKTFPGKSQKGHALSKISKDFFEEEAELSGSEFGSDEDYDAEDMPDELEQNEADKENIGTEEELREQVNKVHMKTMDDDDARRLRLYKEIYLPDGDLYSDGKGRTRQFRWRHVGDDFQLDLFPGNSDDEGDEAKDEDTQWRLERFQREQWLNEQKEKQTAKDTVDDENDIAEENSQFDLLMKTAINKKKKDQMPMNSDAGKTVQKDNEKRFNSPKPVKFRHGSFLRRSKEDRAKIASMVKLTTGNPTSSRGSRNVLYQSITPTADEDEDKNPQLRRSVSDTPTLRAPKAKRPRLDRSQSLAQPSSIFNHM